MYKPKERTRKRRGLAFHLHHDRLVEYCHDYAGRVDCIKYFKEPSEHALRLRLFKLIPNDKLPEDIAKAIRKCINLHRACERNSWGSAYTLPYFRFRDARNEVERLLYTHSQEIHKLHEELCPNCPWDGQTIFPAFHLHYHKRY